LKKNHTKRHEAAYDDSKAIIEQELVASMPKAKSTSKKTSAPQTRKPASNAASAEVAYHVDSAPPDPEALEQVGWLLLDAAEYQRDLAGGPEVPADKWLRGSARRELLRRSRQLAADGDPLGVAEQITDLVKQAGSN
jgi:hypothetical protein